MLSSRGGFVVAPGASNANHHAAADVDLTRGAEPRAGERTTREQYVKNPSIRPVKARYCSTDTLIGPAGQNGGCQIILKPISHHV